MHNALTGAASHCEKSIPEAFAPRLDDGRKCSSRELRCLLPIAESAFTASTAAAAGIHAQRVSFKYRGDAGTD
jgi:hypothetical protein